MSLFYIGYLFLYAGMLWSECEKEKKKTGQRASFGCVYRPVECMLL